MMTKLLAYKWTCVLGLAFLGSFVWAEVSLGGVSGIFLLVCSLAFLPGVLASIIVAAARRSRDGLYRLLIYVAVCLLIFPAIRLGAVIREEIFLTRLPRFQEATEILLKNKADGDVTGDLPAGFSDLNVKDHALISSIRGSITVRYFSRDSSALGHRGYMYRSDDDTATLSKEFPRLGYTKLAPHWFFFSD